MRRLVVLAAALLLLAVPAQAEFEICNQTLDVVNVAIGRRVDESVFQTEGWWTIGSNQCATAIRGPLEYRYIYVYATDVFGQSLLEGTTPMCLADKRFVIEGQDACWQRGHLEANYYEVDTKDVSRWTFFLSPPETP